MEDKKNTDCVYFLASPLTCKKGIQCEFRHSEVARLNPRDCWYWLSGNCLNLDCPFRHPPLDVEEDESSNSDSRVPCYFYSQGYCARGDQCAFMHGYARRSSQVQASAQQQQQQAQPQASAPSAAHNFSSVRENGNLKLTSGTGSVGQRSIPVEAQLVTPEEDEQRHHQVECSSSPTQDEEQDKSDSFDDKSDDPQMLHHDWPMRGSSPEFEDVDPGAQQDYYSDDGENYDTVLDPVNSSSQFVDQFQSQQQRPLESASYDFHYDRGAFQNGSTAGVLDGFNEYKPYDPPYQPSSLPYDCMINSRQAGVQEQRINPDLEALLIARNLNDISRGRLEDRLVFPRGNHGNIFGANRLRLFNGGNSVHNRLVYEEKNPSLRLQRSGFWRMAKGNSRSVHSRLGRPSVKTRLKYVAGNHRQVHHFHHQHNLQHQHRQHGRNARYLGVTQQQQQHWRNNKVAKKAKPNAAAAAAATPAAGSAARNVVNLGKSHFDGPKSLAELKAAKS